MNHPDYDIFRSKRTLHGAQVQLRPIQASDSGPMFADLADIEAKRLTGTHEEFTLEQIERWTATRHEHVDRLDFAVVDAGTGAWLGEAVINDWDPDNHSCSYRVAISADARNSGIGTEVTGLVVDHVFSHPPVHRLELEVYAFNPRAIAVYGKCGFIPEGRRRDALRWDAEWVDAIAMAMLRSDWESARQRSPQDVAEPC